MPYIRPVTAILVGCTGRIDACMDETGQVGFAHSFYFYFGGELVVRVRYFFSSFHGPDSEGCVERYQGSTGGSQRYHESRVAEILKEANTLHSS